MVNGRLVVGVLVTILVAGTLTMASLSMVGVLGGVGDFASGFHIGPTPVPPGQTGEVSGVADPDAVQTGPNAAYYRVTFTFHCLAAWCDTGPNESLELRIQHVNFTEFEWEGLYRFNVEHGDEFSAALARGGNYRLLVKVPDGRIVLLGRYQASTPDAHVDIRATSDLV